MRIFVYTIAALALWKVIIFSIVIAHGKYPRKMERGAVDDLLKVLANITLAIWAAWILFR